MTLPDVDQELERLFEATREGTQPQSDARARIAAALAAQLALGAADKLPVAPRALGAKLWLLSALGVVVALAIGVALWRSSVSAKPVAALAASAHELASPSAVSVLPSAVSASPSIAPAPSASTSATAEAQPSARARAVSPRAPADVVEPPAEPEIIGRMQLALRSGDAPAALVVASEHARYFPNGALTEERESGRAIARCWLAKPEARAALLTAFLGRYGSSPYAARVKAACRP